MNMKRERGKIKKRAQVTIFIIIAIIIVALLVIFLYPRIKTSFFVSKSPQEFIESCMKDDINSALENLTRQGGSINPENAVLYKDNKIEYLCYTNEYYKTCVMQQPFLKQHFEQELASHLKNKAEGCMNSLTEDYQKRGYQVTSKKPGVSASLIPHNLRIEINTQITLKKEATESYDKISIVRRSELYDLLIISESILNLEARYGDSSPETYMLYYPDIKIEKLKQGDGSKIYRLENRETKERFFFASRSLSWSPGYGVEKYVK